MYRHETTAPAQPSEIAPENQYTGDVGIAPLFRGPDGTRASMVRFWPGARTGWHSHEGEQILVVTSGDGLLVNAAHEVIRAQPGVVVRVPAGEPHWHGASSHTGMTHLAVTTGASAYVGAVDDAEHASAQATDRRED